MKRNKSFGFEVIQSRLGGQHARIGELAARLEEYLRGEVATIPELDTPAPAEDNFVFRGTHAFFTSGSAKI